MRAFAAVLRLEALRLLRTRETWSFFLVPAMVAVPLTLLVATMVASMLRGHAVVALPADTPEDLLPALVDALADADLDAVVAADPAAAREAGEADAAVLAWEPGEGIAAARDFAETAAPWRWRAVAVGPEEIRGAVEQALRVAGNAPLEHWIAVEGADPEAVLRPARVASLGIPAEGGHLRPAFVMAYALFVLGATAYFLLTFSIVADRADGTAEALAATPLRRLAWLVARILVLELLELAGAVVVVGWALVLVGVAPPAAASLGWLARLASALFVVQVPYAAIGLAAPSVKTAYNLGSLPALATLALLPASRSPLPPWVPVAGALHAGGVGPTLVAVAVDLAVGLAALVLVDRLVSPHTVAGIAGKAE